MVRLEQNLFAAVFANIKLVVARHVIREAIRNNILLDDGHVFESTSGSMGLGLAFACREFGFPLTIVGDPLIDESIRPKLEALGAHVVIVDFPLPEGGFQRARLNKLRELMSHNHAAFWPQQYDNPLAVKAYETVAPAIAESVSDLEYLVAPTGTGASGTGLARALNNLGCSAHLVAVDTHYSVLFGQPDKKRLLRGLGNSIIPKNLDYSLVDQCHWVSAAEAFYMTNLLFKERLLDVGPTSGAAYIVANWLAKEYPRKKIVFTCPDSGERYWQTIYRPKWLALQGVLINEVSQQPKLVEHPNDGMEQWSYMFWRGRDIWDVVPRDLQKPNQSD